MRPMWPTEGSRTYLLFMYSYEKMNMDAKLPITFDVLWLCSFRTYFSSKNGIAKVVYLHLLCPSSGRLHNTLWCWTKHGDTQCLAWNKIVGRRVVCHFIVSHISFCFNLLWNISSVWSQLVHLDLMSVSVRVCGLHPRFYFELACSKNLSEV